MLKENDRVRIVNRPAVESGGKKIEREGIWQVEHKGEILSISSALLGEFPKGVPGLASSV